MGEVLGVYVYITLRDRSSNLTNRAHMLYFTACIFTCAHTLYMCEHTMYIVCCTRVHVSLTHPPSLELLQCMYVQDVYVCCMLCVLFRLLW